MPSNLPLDAVLDGDLLLGDASVREHIRYLIFDCQWFEDSDGFLYICDLASGEIYTTEGEIENDRAELIWHDLMLEEEGGLTLAECTEIVRHRDVEMTAIPTILRRFDYDGMGFYHA